MTISATDSAAEHSFDSLSIGQEASLERVISAEDVDLFAKLSGDHNPLHTDSAYAQTTPFKERVVHGMLLGSFVSALVGMQLPGRSALLVKETIEFKKPVFIGAAVTVKGKIISKSVATRLIELSITITSDAMLVAEGTVTVQVRT